MFGGCVAAGGDCVGKRRLSGSTRADDCHKPGIKLDDGCCSPGGVKDRNAGDDLRGRGADRGAAPTNARPAGSMTA